MSPYDEDPEALAWARGKAQKLADKARRFESQNKAEGNEERARKWRSVAYMVESHLIGGTGCVIASFDERLPQVAAALKENTDGR